MKGLLIRFFIGFALLLWAWDMVYPWQKVMLAEENRHTQVQQRKILRVGLINHPLSYFVGAEGKAGL